jgi:hypothetical protein
MNNISIRNTYALTPEGWHNANIRIAEAMQSRFAANKEQIKIVFDIEGTEHECRVVDWFNPSLHEKSKLLKVLKVIYPEGEAPTDEVILSTLIGKPVAIKVEHNQKDNTFYANPVDYRRIVKEEL